MSFNEILNYVKNLETSDDPCMICYLGKKEELHKTPCGHYFHQECLKGLKSCPYCSKKLPKMKVLKTSVNSKLGDKCHIILKSGNRKGEECGRVNCHYHK